jgi:hypothetical protein
MVIRKVREVEDFLSLRLTPLGLQGALHVLWLGIRGPASAEMEVEARIALEKLPFVYFKALADGETVQVGVDDIQLTVARSSPLNPVAGAINCLELDIPMSNAVPPMRLSHYVGEQVRIVYSCCQLLY